MSSYKNIVKIAFRDLSKKLGIREEFIIDIYEEENSWSFISKLAQLIEGVFTKNLVKRLNEPEIYSTISNLSQATRITLLHDLKIISKEQKLLFLTVAEIRNDYIHNISNVDVNLKDYLSGLSKSRQIEIFKRFKHFFDDEKISCEVFIGDCKELIFTACALEIIKVHGDVEVLDAERKHKNFRSEKAEKLLPNKIKGSMYLEDKMLVLDYVDNAKKILKEKGLI